MKYCSVCVPKREQDRGTEAEGAGSLSFGEEDTEG